MKLILTIYETVKVSYSKKNLLVFDIAAKRRKKHKNQISRLVNSMFYNVQKSKIRLITNPSFLEPEQL